MRNPPHVNRPRRPRRIRNADQARALRQGLLAGRHHAPPEPHEDQHRLPGLALWQRAYLRGLLEPRLLRPRPPAPPGAGRGQAGAPAILDELLAQELAHPTDLGPLYDLLDHHLAAQDRPLVDRRQRPVRRGLFSIDYQDQRHRLERIYLTAAGDLELADRLLPQPPHGELP